MPSSSASFSTAALQAKGFTPPALEMTLIPRSTQAGSTSRSWARKSVA
jgi:hypothetical protein